MKEVCSLIISCLVILAVQKKTLGTESKIQVAAQLRRHLELHRLWICIGIKMTEDARAFSNE